MSSFKMLRIYLGESDKYKNKNLYEYILNLAKEHNLKGATVIRGIAGFGSNSYIHTTNILRLSEDLPIIIEIIDEENKIFSFLEIIKTFFKEGTIVLLDIEKSYHFPILAKDIMIKKVISVEENENLNSILNLILKNKVKFLPVIKDKTLQGVITGKDILEKIDLKLKINLTYEDLNKEIQYMVEKQKLSLTAKDLMQRKVKVGYPQWKLDKILHFMFENKIKRLPIVNSNFELLGLITRTDILSYLAHYTSPKSSLNLSLKSGTTAKELATLDLPTFSPEEKIEKAIADILKSPLKMGVCLNEKKEIKGVVFDSDLIKYFIDDSSNLLNRLKNIFGSLDKEKYLKDIMRTDFISVLPEENLGTIIHIFKDKGIKRLIVMDEEKKFQGVVERDNILNKLL
ncbi:MAG: Uncharacterized protein XD41_0511 [Desulfonauticus sp. 38_4375]|nr:MAG: Uncharacterized protein XD41_0511 [Desulfonauticus sp. 38_4375]